MYRIRLAIVAFLLATIGLQAQEGFYYQAVIKNTDGSPLKETPVKIRIRIIEGETTLQYEEVREITTSREGFISFIIGENASEDFTAINWQGELYLQDEIDTGEGYGAPTRMPLLKTPRSYISDRAISVLDNSITSASILDGSILSDDLSDQSVLTAKLADSLITSTKIARSAVTNTAIASNAISTENVIDSTLTNADISPDAAIDFSKINIPDGSITLEKVNLEEGSIAYSKLIVEDGEIPYSKILVGDSDIAFEKLNITKENINDLGIISNYEGGSNITITDTSIALDDEISLTKVTSNLIGDVLNADEETVLEVGSSSATANYTGNVKGNLTGNLLNSNSQTIFTNGSSTVLPKYFGDVYYRESDGSETLILDSKNKIFFGTLEGSLNGSWTGNILGSNNEIVLDPITSDGSALFTGNVEGNLTGDVTGDLTGNADTATTLSSTLSIEKGGTGATTAADARTNLDVDQAGTDNSTNVTLATVTDNYLTLSGQEITAGNVPISLGGTGATTAADARTNLDVDQAGTDNSTNVTLATVTDNYLTLSGQEITAGNVPISLGGTGATTAADARTNLDVDQAGTDNSTNVTLATVTDNYLTLSGQEITAGNVPISLGGTGATTAADARTNLDVDQAGTDNSTNVTLATVTDNYLTLSGQEITAGNVPISLGGTGATTAADARTNLDVDQAGTDNSTNVTLATVTDNYLTLSGQEITAGNVPISLGGTGATTAADARTNLDVDQAGTVNYILPEATDQILGGVKQGVGMIISNGTISIDDNAITTLKIADNAITESKIADDAINTLKIADNAITESKIADGSITSSKIADDAVTNSKIADPELKEIADLASTDSNFIVGDGTSFVTESGSTARNSLGIYSGTLNWSENAGAADTIFAFTGVAGVTTSSLIIATIKSQSNGQFLESAIATGAGEITITLSGVPGSNTVLTYIVIN